MRDTITLTIAVMLFTVCSAISAGDSGKTEVYKFSFDGQSGPVELELNSDTMGFGLHDLHPGDSRTTVTENGASITISRLADVYALDVGGEVFEIPARHGPGHLESGHGQTRHIAIAHGMADGLTILTKDPLDENRRATIRAALSAAGIVDEVEFLSPGLTLIDDETIEQDIEIDGDSPQRMIIKRVISD